MTDSDILNATKEYESQVRTLKNQITRIQQETKQYEARSKENQEKIKLSTRLPYLVATVGEILNAIDDDEENNGSGLGNQSIKSKNTDKKEVRKAVIVKTTSR
jgi:ATP-dependent 26S proteasome regulatory subunit